MGCFSSKIDRSLDDGASAYKEKSRSPKSDSTLVGSSSKKNGKAAMNKGGRVEDVANEVKVLLLGAGDSGKSTIMKQMRLLYSPGFSQSARKQYKTPILENVLVSLRLLLASMEAHNLQLLRENEQYVPIVAQPTVLHPEEPVPESVAQAVRAICSDPNAVAALEFGTQFSLMDNFYYFRDHVERLFDPDYVPTDQDILHCRVKTTGITEESFVLNRYRYRFFDVGGQRSERRKWIHCFESVSALLFLVSLTGYDQCLVEDNTGNQMQEALLLWDSICNSNWFASSAMILFLNKLDLFERKIHISPIQPHFPDYQEYLSTPTFVQTQCPTADAGVRSAMYFFYLKFESLNRVASRSCYCHFITATDTSLLQRVMVSVQDTILSNNLESLMF
ncbi:G-protein alpha subunit [Schizosaccharomyces japonicus yFS275]|uniref:G-protein alpha subunit n=1 Tax=Schizosaccharomyces japonicus (strain yFS275 / FY16936) TaxID=402676 RepID=B6K1X0_SCHJY|nr:G-protein alpha subunit [Schizosaccharomyces japonicus yFS275]EEB07151.1 G-protein alpha subunit [Schizosaccharomyces japonicus yFS275]